MRAERSALVDEYAEDGESVVMLPDGRVLVLSELGTAVLGHLSRGPLDLGELAVLLVADFGAPPHDPSGVRTTGELLTTLSESGLVSLSGR